MKLSKVLGGQPVEVVSGVVMLGVGIYITTVGADASEPNNGLIAAGAILTALAGVMLSWVASRAYNAREAREEFNEHLDALSRNLGQAAGHISRVVEQAEAREIHPATAFALVSQGARMIYGQVSEIAVLRGAEFDSAYLLKTASQLDKLAQQLERGGTAEQGIEEVRREIEDVRTTLKSRSGSQRSFSQATVECPYCSVLNESELGDIPGDTSMWRCQSCQTRFNVHRSYSGGAFARQLGPTSPPEEIEGIPNWGFTCPSCNNAMTARGSRGTHSMICTTCCSDLLVDPQRQSVESRGVFEHTTAPIIGRRGSRPLVRCPVCQRVLHALLNNGHSYFGFCKEDRQLMEVGHDEFAQWRQSDSGPVPLDVAADAANVGEH